MSRDDEWRNKILDEEYESIMKAIVGGKYAGKTIDVYNIKELVVAAYYIGKFDNPHTSIYTNIYPKE